jgi:hypothetical protein
MLLKNLDLEGGANNSRQLVNGSRGVVIGTVTKAEAIKVTREGHPIYI